MGVRKIYFLIGFVAFCFLEVSAQVGIGTLTPQTTLDIRAINHNGAVTATDGILVPRVNDLATAGGQDGQLVYLIADAGSFSKGFYHWDGSGWRPLKLGSSSAVAHAIVAPDATIPGAPTSVTGFNVSPNRSITDNNAFNITIPVSGVLGNTSFVSIEINIIHTWDADLDIFLQSPTGQILELTTDNGSNGDDFQNTLFIDSASQNITSGSAPFNGSYRAEGSSESSGSPVGWTGNVSAFSGFNGFDPNGNWILRIGDDAGVDTGVFTSATLNIAGNTPPDWKLIAESSIVYFDDSAIIVRSTYSADPMDSYGVVTALTRTATSVGPAGTVVAALPTPVLNYASASSPVSPGDFWVNTFNQARDAGLTNNTTYYYQLWRQGNIEAPVGSNQSFSLIPVRLGQ